MKTLHVLALAIGVGLLAETSNGAEFTFRTSQIAIPSGKSIIIDSDQALEVDSFQLDGEIRLEGHSLRVDTSTLTIGKTGAILGYSRDNVPNLPPNRPAFGSPAAEGIGAPPQFSNNTFYLGGSAGQGGLGANGQDGDSGNAGNPQPGSLVLITESIRIDGSILLKGQIGSVGQAGQNGQDGGIGGKGMDAWCDEGNVSAACYSGNWTSGPGGLGGFGGQGGPGGHGGAAAPVVLFTYSNSDPPLEKVSSFPGDGGSRGPPGTAGRVGSPGGPGKSCSAEAHWGSFFGSCSTHGGAVTTNTVVDTRTAPTYLNGDQGPKGSGGDWGRDPTTAILLGKGFKPQNGVMSLRVPLAEEVKSTRRYALRVELIGRLATTILRIRDEYLSAETDGRSSLERQFQADLLPIIARAAAIVDADDIIGLIGPSSAEPLSTLINATIPILRERFVSERNQLLKSCTNIRQAVKGSLGDSALGYFQRTLSWCSASQLTWLPFISGQQSVIFTTPQAMVGSQFAPYFTVKTELVTQGAPKAANGISVSSKSRDRASNSQRLTPELLHAIQSRLAPAGKYVFSIARSRDLLDDMLALERGAALIKIIAP